MSKKKLFTLALVVIMIAILSFSTLAWFNDTDEVTNKFLVAGSDDDTPDEVFSVDVWETVDTDNDGTPENVGKEEDGGDATFADILPGSKLVKQPMVVNTGYYDQYIRVVVTLSDAKAWVDALGYGYDLSEIFVGHDETMWTRVKGTHDENNDQLVYVYYLNKILKADESVALFTHVQIPTQLDQEDMAKLNADGAAGFQLHIRADAIQTENLGVNTEDARHDAVEAFANANWGNEANTEPQP